MRIARGRRMQWKESGLYVKFFFKPCSCVYVNVWSLRLDTEINDYDEPI